MFVFKAVLLLLHTVVYDVSVYNKTISEAKNRHWILLYAAVKTHIYQPTPRAIQLRKQPDGLYLFLRFEGIKGHKFQEEMNMKYFSLL